MRSTKNRNFEEIRHHKWIGITQTIDESYSHSLNQPHRHKIDLMERNQHGILDKNQPETHLKTLRTQMLDSSPSCVFCQAPAANHLSSKCPIIQQDPETSCECDYRTTTTRPELDFMINIDAAHKKKVDNRINNWLTPYLLKETSNRKFNPTINDKENKPEGKRTESLRQPRFNKKDETWRKRPKKTATTKTTDVHRVEMEEPKKNNHRR